MSLRNAFAGGLAAVSLLGLAACGAIPGAEDGEDASAEQSEGGGEEDDGD